MRICQKDHYIETIIMQILTICHHFYEQLDQKIATKSFKRSGVCRGFSVLSFILHNFLLDIENISGNLLNNYIESIFVILNLRFYAIAKWRMVF